jgi:hypothetical protein
VKRPSSIGSVLMGLIIVLWVVTLITVPIFLCPLNEVLAYTGQRCPRCDGRGRIALVRLRFGDLDKVPWDGKAIGAVAAESGFRRTSFWSALETTGLCCGELISNRKRIKSAQRLAATGLYEEVTVRAHLDSEGKVVVLIGVVEK